MARSWVVLVAGAALFAAAAGWWVAGEPAVHTVTVVDTVDGDTLVVRFDDGTEATVRLLAVDTPETKHPTVGVECFGPEASAYTHRRLLGVRVAIELDVEAHDRYGRLLAHVWIDGHRYADELLALGLAELYVLPPNGEYARTQLRLELDARRRGVGLWGAC